MKTVARNRKGCPNVPEHLRDSPIADSLEIYVHMFVFCTYMLNRFCQTGVYRMDMTKN